MFNGEKLEGREDIDIKVEHERAEGEPSFAYVAASWFVLLVGVLAYLIGLYNAHTMELNEKGYYFLVLFFGLFAAVALQKTVRDREEGVKVTSIFYGICWFALLLSMIMMVIGLWNAGSIVFSEKGFYAMSFVLSLFAAISVQKNIRDTAYAREE